MCPFCGARHDEFLPNPPAILTSVMSDAGQRDETDRRRNIGQRNHDHALLERSQRMAADKAPGDITGTSVSLPQPTPQASAFR